MTRIALVWLADLLTIDNRQLSIGNILCVASAEFGNMDRPTR